MTELNVCIGSACHVNGAHNVIQQFQHLIEANELGGKIDFKASFCMRNCGKTGVSVRVDGKEYRISPDNARSFFRETVMPLVK